MKLVVSAEALGDLERLRHFLARESPAAGARAAAALEAAIQSLHDFPDRGRPAGADLRELNVPFGRSAYVLRYAVVTEADMIVVIRHWHAREER